MPPQRTTRFNNGSSASGAAPAAADEPIFQPAPSGADEAAPAAPPSAAGATQPSYRQAAGRGVDEPRMGTPAPANGAAAVQPGSRPPSGRVSPDTEMLRGIHASLGQLGAIAEGLKELGQRVGDLERDKSPERASEQRYPDDDDEGYSSDGSAESVYLPFSEGNPHWVAKQQLQAPTVRPRKMSLYGYQAADVLAAGSRGKPRAGSLRAALVYGESAAAPMWEVTRALEDLLEQADEAGDTVLGDIVAPIVATQRACYELLNEQRALIVARARTMGPDAEAYDKDELEFIENSFGARDEPTADMPAALADLKDKFVRESRKADLRVRAGRGRSSAGGGLRDADRHRQDDRRGERRGERDESQKKQRGNRGGRKQREREEARSRPSRNDRAARDDRASKREDGSATRRDQSRGKPEGGAKRRDDDRHQRREQAGSSRDHARQQRPNRQSRGDDSSGGEWEVARGRHDRRSSHGGGKGKAPRRAEEHGSDADSSGYRSY